MIFSGHSLAATSDLRADALLAIDMNRSAMIERVVATWQGKLSIEQEALVRTALAMMRADRLLAASLAPSLDGLLSVIQSEEQGSLAAKTITSKLAGDADLGYTPVAPCRLFDTRTTYGGTGPLLPDVFRNFGTSGSLTGQGGIPGCSIPLGAQAIVMQTGALLPSALGYIAGGAQGATAYPNAVVLYQAGQQYSTSITLPLNTTNGQFTLVARFNGTEAYGDVLGYFNTITPNSGPVGPTGPTGPTGPAGAIGATGPQGIQGPVGPIGPQGLQGIQGPQGVQGLTGTTGATGADGRTVLNGTVAPNDALGVPGDFYLDTTTNVLYGPKAGGTWPATGVSLVGPAGPTGATGATGPAGADGATGATGPAGATGANGAQGPQGEVGPQGATGPAGPTGATGAAGATGATGAQGPVGATGPQGPQGDTGATGPVGPQGPQGLQGVQGAVGPAGPQGATGADGLDGNTVLNGAGAPGAAVGVNGDFYVDLATTTLYGPKAGGTWPATGVPLVGPAGPTGATGATGAQGPQGEVGPQGATGPAGPTGAQGPIGPIGPQGLQGIQGPQGVQGPAGATGATGATGPSGTTGQDAITVSGTGFLSLAANPATNAYQLVPGLEVPFTVPAGDPNLNRVIISYTVGAYVNSSGGGSASGVQVGLFTDSTCTTNVGGTLSLHAINDNGQGYKTEVSALTHTFVVLAGTYTYAVCARRSYIPGSTTAYFGNSGIVVSSNGTATTGGTGPWQVPGIQGRLTAQVLRK
jgi:hypothetical protein